MSSSDEIPNLRTLLGSSRRGVSRGRGRGRGIASSPSQGQAQVKDNAIRGTDQDAAGSRLSCVELRYLHDPYAKLLATQTSTRRLPLLNRGTYVRTSAIDNLITKFLLSDPASPKQIISLGAGTDTRFFRLLDLYPNIRLVYHEIDFPSNNALKIKAIRQNAQLYQKLTHKPTEESSYHSDNFNVHALDLRSLLALPEATPLPSIQNLDPNLPTLMLSEMCLVYLDSSAVLAILSSLLNHYLKPITPASLVLYEPILPNDAFGRTMISNLRTRNIHLPTLLAYPELSDQRARLRSYGFSDGAKAVDTNFIWKRWVSEEEKERVAGLELLDELEELELLLKHYCVAWGWRDGDSQTFSKAWMKISDREGT